MVIRCFGVEYGDEMKQARKKLKLAVIYPFFPHYRKGVINQLLADEDLDALFVGDRKALDPSIALFAEFPPGTFVDAPCVTLPGGFVYQRKVISVVIKNDVDAVIILGNPLHLSAWIGAAICKMLRKKIYFWTHGWLQDENGVKGFVRKTFYNMADGLLLYGERAKEIGIRNGFKPEKMHVIYNSLDFSEQTNGLACDGNLSINTVKQKYFDHPNLPLLICTARLTPQCRFDLLLEAAHILKGEGACVNIILVGEGPEKPKLKDLSMQHGLSVYFFGECYSEEVLSALISSADLTVSPGKVGLTAIHSLSYGVPVITHRNFNKQMPEYESITPGFTGDFFEEGDAYDLACVIKQWFSKPKDAHYVRACCKEVILRKYNPKTQCQLIKRALFSK